VVRVGSRELGAGEGRSKKAAEQLAAEAAYTSITGEQPPVSGDTEATAPVLGDVVPAQPASPEPASGAPDA
jgi:hypothetical protein